MHKCNSNYLFSLPAQTNYWSSISTEKSLHDVQMRDTSFWLSQHWNRMQLPHNCSALSQRSCSTPSKFWFHPVFRRSMYSARAEPPHVRTMHAVLSRDSSAITLQICMLLFLNKFGTRICVFGPRDYIEKQIEKKHSTVMPLLRLTYS